MRLHFAQASTLLFVGDSITDCGRSKCQETLGDGYPRLVRDWLLAADPDTAPRVVNTGVSGNKITDLARRWDADVLAHKPDVLSIKIGINDVWHGLSGYGEGVPIDSFVATYRDLLNRTRAALPTVRLVLCEPSVIWPPAPREGNAALQPYVAAVGDLAKEFDAVKVPLHAAFEHARRRRPDVAWAPDGVHPSSAGHMLIARTWFAAAGLLDAEEREATKTFQN